MKLRLRGHVKITQHTSAGDVVVVDEPNTIIPAGRDYLAGLFLKDGVNLSYSPGLTQIGLWAGGIERYKADLTDRYITGGSNAVAVLYVPTTQPATQPHTFDEIRLYANTGGSVYVAQKTGLSVAKNNTLALTVEWTLTLS
jgi:hypothetical protein